jgi:chromosomal replication initiator protein
MIEVSNMSAYSIPGFVIIGEANAGEVIRSVCEYFDITEAEMKKDSHKPNIVFPRFIAMYLLSVECKLSLMSIAKIFGKRDHTTVMNAKKKINDFISIKDEITISSLKAIRRAIKTKRHN